MASFTQLIQGTNPSVLWEKQDSSEYIREDVNQFALEANKLAKQLLAPKNARYDGPLVIRNHYYTPFYSSWFYPQSIYFIPSYDRRDHDNKDGASLLLGIVATIGLLFASFAVGTAVATHNDASQALQETHDFQQKISNYRFYAGTGERSLLRAAGYAASLKERICTRIKNSATAELALRITLAASLALTALGAFTVAPPLLGLGLLFAVSSGAAMLFKWGFESLDKSNLRDAASLNASLVNLKRHL